MTKKIIQGQFNTLTFPMINTGGGSFTTLDRWQNINAITIKVDYIDTGLFHIFIAGGEGIGLIEYQTRNFTDFTSIKRIPLKDENKNPFTNNTNLESLDLLDGVSIFSVDGVVYENTYINELNRNYINFYSQIKGSIGSNNGNKILISNGSIFVSDVNNIYLLNGDLSINTTYNTSNTILSICYDSNGNIYSLEHTGELNYKIVKLDQYLTNPIETTIETLGNSLQSISNYDTNLYLTTNDAHIITTQTDLTGLVDSGELTNINGWNSISSKTILSGSDIILGIGLKKDGVTSSDLGVLFYNMNIPSTPVLVGKLLPIDSSISPINFYENKISRNILTNNALYNNTNTWMEATEYVKGFLTLNISSENSSNKFNEIYPSSGKLFINIVGCLPISEDIEWDKTYSIVTKIAEQVICDNLVGLQWDENSTITWSGPILIEGESIEILGIHINNSRITNNTSDPTSPIVDILDRSKYLIAVIDNLGIHYIDINSLNIPSDFDGIVVNGPINSGTLTFRSGMSTITTPTLVNRLVYLGKDGWYEWRNTTLVKVYPNASSGGVSPELEGMIIDLHDESMGRWVIDTTANTLTKYRVNGEVLKVYSMTEIVPKTYGIRTPQ